MAQIVEKQPGDWSGLLLQLKELVFYQLFCFMTRLLVDSGPIDYAGDGCYARRGARAAESDSLLMGWKPFYQGFCR